MMIFLFMSTGQKGFWTDKHHIHYVLRDVLRQVCTTERPHGDPDMGAGSQS